MDTDVRILQDVLEYACINRHFEMVECKIWVVFRACVLPTEPNRACTTTVAALTSLLSQRGVKVVEKGSVLSIRLACCVVDQEVLARML